MNTKMKRRNHLGLFIFLIATIGLVNNHNAYADFEIEHKIKPLLEDHGAGDNFGYSVDIDGDTAVVGAPLDDDNGIDSGRAFIFERDANGNWTYSATLQRKPNVAQAGDNFGHSVSISGSRVVVGAPGVNSFAGGFYVLVRPNNGWKSASSPISPTYGISENSNDYRFGSSVAIKGNLITIGAPNVVSDKGIVFVYEIDNFNSLRLKTNLFASDAIEGDQLGYSVSISEDQSRFVVGAPFKNNGNGKVYVFDRPTNGWSKYLTESFSFTASNGSDNDRFGHSVDISGDTVVVGAPFNDQNGNNNIGSIYVFQEPDGGWQAGSTNTETLRNDNPNLLDNAQLGYSVSISGDIIVAGQRLTQSFNGSSGTARVYDLSNGSLDIIRALRSSDRESNDKFGHAVAISGRNIIVGAIHDDDAGQDSGSAYVYVDNTPPVARVAKPAKSVLATSPDGALVTLDAKQSYDIDTNTVSNLRPQTLTYVWEKDGVVFLDAGNEPFSPDIQLPIGTHNFKLIVSDGIAQSEDSFQIEIFNNPPVASAAKTDKSVVATSPDGALITLDASASTDPDIKDVVSKGNSQVLTYVWEKDGELFLDAGKQASVGKVQLELGIHDFKLIVSDGVTQSEESFQIEVFNTPPVAVAEVFVEDIQQFGDEEGVITIFSDDQTGILVTLDATKSFDPDNNDKDNPNQQSLTYNWRFNGDDSTILNGALQTDVEFPIGETLVEVIVEDSILNGSNSIDVHSFTIVVIKNITNFDLFDQINTVGGNITSAIETNGTNNTTAILDKSNAILEKLGGIDDEEVNVIGKIEEVDNNLIGFVEAIDGSLSLLSNQNNVNAELIKDTSDQLNIKIDNLQNDINNIEIPDNAGLIGLNASLIADTSEILNAKVDNLQLELSSIEIPDHTDLISANAVLITEASAFLKSEMELVEANLSGEIQDSANVLSEQNEANTGLIDNLSSLLSASVDDLKTGINGIVIPDNAGIIESNAVLITESSAFLNAKLDFVEANLINHNQDTASSLISEIQTSSNIIGASILDASAELKSSILTTQSQVIDSETALSSEINENETLLGDVKSQVQILETNLIEVIQNAESVLTSENNENHSAIVSAETNIRSDVDAALTSVLSDHIIKRDEIITNDNINSDNIKNNDNLNTVMILTLEDENQIEAHLFDKRQIITLVLPIAYGGKLELVRDFVQAKITGMQGAGFNISKAQSDFDKGIEDFNASDYSKAYDHFVDTYQELLKAL